MALLARDGAAPRLRGAAIGCGEPSAIQFGERGRGGERILCHQFARMRVSEERVSRRQFRAALDAAEYRDA
jgi:hypothetical protein